MCQQPIEHRGVKIRPCLMEESTMAGDNWYVVYFDRLTGQELPEQDCLKFLSKPAAREAVDTLLNALEHAPWTPDTPTP